jgi:hypothetical protein
MKLQLRITLALLATIGLAGLLPAQSYKLQPSGRIPADVPAADAQLLDAQGSRLVDTSGNVACDVWFSKAIPTQASASSEPDILYGNLALGTFVGIAHYSSAAKDARGQAIKPGFYTLRYALIPQDGNHLGVSNYRDFVLLNPIAADTNLTQALSFNDLIALSRKASGTGHPLVVALAPPSSGSLPALSTDDQGATVLQVKLHGKGSDFPMSLLLLGGGANPGT